MTISFGDGPPSVYRRDILLKYLPISILSLAEVVHAIDAYMYLMPPKEAVVAVMKSRLAKLLRIGYFPVDLEEVFNFAAEKGNVEILGMILSRAKMKLGIAAVLAAANGHPDAAKLLLLRIEPRDDQNATAWEVMRVAAANGHLTVVDMAMGYTTSSGSEWDHVLSRAISGDHLEVIRILVHPFFINLNAALEPVNNLEQYDIVQVIVQAMDE